MLFTKIFSTSKRVIPKSCCKLYTVPSYYQSEAIPKKSLYRVLNLPTDASPEDIKKSYLDLAKRYHPDTAPNDPSLAEKFREVAEAYRTLSDPKKREQYDIENKIISPNQVMYDKVDPEFKNEDIYANWMANKTRSRETDESKELGDYFKEKYFKETSQTTNNEDHLRAFSDINSSFSESIKDGNMVLKYLYDFRFLLGGGFVVFSLATLGGVLYEINSQKKKIQDMRVFKEGKGIIVKLTPLNPV